MKFTTKNKYKENQENEVEVVIVDNLNYLLELMATDIIHEAALKNLENSSECLDEMVKKVVAEDLSVEAAIKMGFVHGFKHAVVESLTEEDE
ncbi:hypothetical protein [Lactococcus lactis]